MHTQIAARQLAAWLDDTLQIARWKDYCPNGLQVEGKTQVRHLVAGVTASEALLRAAIERGADGVLVHHGWFWKNEDPRVRGPRRTRLALALAHNLNLFAYHLPLDAHPEWGNNAQLARVLGLVPAMPAPSSLLGADELASLIWLGTPTGIDTLGQLAQRVHERLARPPLLIGDVNQPVQRVAWCTGGAQNMFAQAIEAGADVYITGEISESAVHLARETGVGFVSAGHHATERYGVQALGMAIADKFGVRVDFIDIDNPV